MNTKTDIVAMLTDLQMEIKEIDSRPGYDGNGMPTFANDYIRIIKVNEMIQQKINSLQESEDKEQEDGMSIDDCIKMLIAKIECIKRETSGTDTDCNSHNCDYCSLCYKQGTRGEQKETLLFAVETMRKYQQIEQIVKQYKKLGNIDFSMQIICGVVEDGND